MRVAVMAGGISPERNVSLASGQAVAKALRDRGHEAAERDDVGDDRDADAGIDHHLVLGKFLGAWGFYCVMLLMTLQFPITLTRLATPDRGPFYSGYLGMALFGGTFIAVGLLISAMTKNQVVAYVGTLFVLLFLWLLSWAGSGDAWWQTLLTYISVPSHLDSFAKGMIDTRDIFFYLSFIGGMLFLTVRALAAWKWR